MTPFQFIFHMRPNHKSEIATFLSKIETADSCPESETTTNVGQANFLLVKAVKESEFVVTIVAKERFLHINRSLVCLISTDVYYKSIFLCETVIVWGISSSLH